MFGIKTVWKKGHLLPQNLYRITRKKTVVVKGLFGIKRKKRMWVTEWVDWETYKRYKHPKLRMYEEWFID